MSRGRLGRGWELAGLALLVAAVCRGVAPAASAAPPERTLVLAIEVDRDQATLVGFAAKARAPRGDDVITTASPETPRLRVTLAGGDGPSAVRQQAAPVAHVALDALCLEHGPDAPPHVVGDRIRVHRDVVLVELPDVVGATDVQVDVEELSPGPGPRPASAPAGWGGGAVADGMAPRPLARLPLARELFRPDASEVALADLTIAAARFADGAGADGAGGADLATTGRVHWPEEYGDAERVIVYGDAAESDRRINVVLVPDGYRYAEKAALRAHADALVDAFRARTPYRELSGFLNFVLVLAYSTDSGTDQCDCGAARDTAMNTRFPAAGGSCGSDENRCLYYGTANGGPACDATTSAANIAAAELRAPAHDATIVLVNTARYGGCGGTRAVVSAANASAAEIAIHELGHSLAGLDDEYAGDSACGTASGFNVSSDPANGSWPEWVAELGAPREGAATYDRCVFRPAATCAMRELGRPFCPVCAQRFALTVLGHPRVHPTAPVAGQSPAPAVAAAAGVPVDFAVDARLPAGPGVTQRISWTLLSPGDATPRAVGSGSLALRLAFPAPGTYTLRCEVAAATNLVKRAVEGANVGAATWTVTVAAPCGSPLPPLANVLRLTKSGGDARLTWDDVPAAEAYAVGRASDRRLATLALAGTAAAGSPAFVDPGAAATVGPWLYRVAQERCGVRSAY